MGGERDPARSNAGLFDGESLEEGAELPPPRSAASSGGPRLGARLEELLNAALEHLLIVEPV